MTNISALLHFLVWIEIQKYHFRCVPTLVDLWVYLVDVWSSHIWWPFANGLVSQMSRHLHCFNARVVPEELSNRRMVPLFRFLFSCVFFQPEFVGPFFHHVREGVPYQSYPKSRVWPLPGFFLKDLSIYTQRWSFITKKWYFPSKVFLIRQNISFSHIYLTFSISNMIYTLMSKKCCESHLRTNAWILGTYGTATPKLLVNLQGFKMKTILQKPFSDHFKM